MKKEEIVEKLTLLIQDIDCFRNDMGDMSDESYDLSKEVLQNIKAAVSKKPRVIVTIEGGVVTSILSDVEIDTIVVDYDTDGADENDLKEIPQGTQGPVEDAYVYEGEINEHTPEKVEQIFEICRE